MTYGKDTLSSLQTLWGAIILDSANVYTDVVCDILDGELSDPDQRLLDLYEDLVEQVMGLAFVSVAFDQNAPKQDIINFTQVMLEIIAERHKAIDQDLNSFNSACHHAKDRFQGAMDEFFPL